MKIDFHTHGKLAKGLPFSKAYTIDLFKEAKEAGLDAICLTEHFNSRGYRDLIQFIVDNYERVGDCYQVDGLKIFIGMEVDIEEVGHVLVIGDVEDILEIHHRLEGYMSGSKQLDYEDYMSGESYIKAHDLMILCKEYPVLIGAAHAIREGSNIPTLSEEVLSQFDFFDLNGKDCSKDITMKEQIAELAGRFNKPIVAGSDTHQCLQYGCIYNVFERDCTTIAEIHEEMKAGRYEIEMLDYIAFKVKSANLLKKSLKTMYAKCGEYVLEEIS